MTSYRTIIGTLVAALVVPWAARHGVTLDATQQVTIVAGIAGVLASSHLLEDLRAFRLDLIARIQNRSKPQQVVVIGMSPQVQDGLAEAVGIVLAKRFRLKQPDPNPIVPGEPANSTGAKS